MHATEGQAVNILIMAEGVTSRNEHGLGNELELDKLHCAAREAAQVVGAQAPTFMQFPDNRMDTIDQLTIVKSIEIVIEKYQPSIIYTHHPLDVNIDHRITSQAVVTASRAMPQSCVESILFFEIPSSTEWQVPSAGLTFAPNWFVDITESLQTKLKALRCYNSEMRDFPHPRSIEAVECLAKWRGASSGFTAAEAFVLGRHRRSYKFNQAAETL
jgi:LmbE family N-acetylglucosaminyl deacetylase